MCTACSWREEEQQRPGSARRLQERAGAERALQQWLSQSPWPHETVRRALARLGAWVRIPFLVGFENVSRIHMMASDPDEWVVLC